MDCQKFIFADALQLGKTNISTIGRHYRHLPLCLHARSRELRFCEGKPRKLGKRSPRSNIKDLWSDQDQRVVPYPDQVWRKMMITPSKAPVLSNEDGLSSLERAAQQKLMLGLFLPIQNCGWTVSTAPRSTTWEFDYNAQLAVRADELGFDLTFGLGLWPGKGGLGGKVRFWETSLDPLITVAGLAAITNNILLISTVHVLYGWHPLHLAKFGCDP